MLIKNKKIEICIEYIKIEYTIEIIIKICFTDEN